MPASIHAGVSAPEVLAAFQRLRQELAAGPADAVASTATANGTTTLTSYSARTQIFTGTNNQTVQLPAVNAAGSSRGIEFQIKNRSTCTLTVQSLGGDTIEGAPSTSVTAGSSLVLVGDGVAEWVII